MLAHNQHHHNQTQGDKKRGAKRKPPPERNNNGAKRSRGTAAVKDEMLEVYQPWVVRTYGDLAKTKTVTLRKYARILRTLRGEETASADTSKFRFWVKAKGFRVGQPEGYEAKPADAIAGRFSVCDTDEGIEPVASGLKGSTQDPPLYVPTSGAKTVNGEPVYRKVAVVENFFDIIYNVHVELEGKPGKHAGQKRTYRTITETYAFLPREAVTRFLLGCIECQKRPRSVSPASLLPTPSPSPTSHSAHHTHTPTSDGSCENLDTQLELRNSPREEEDAEKKEEDPPGRPEGRRTKKSSPKESPKLWSPVKCIEEERDRRVILPGNIDYSMPITTTYLKYMKSLGCKEEEALNFNSKHENLSTPESSEENGDETYNGNKNGNVEASDMSSISGNEEMAGLWAQYHTALGLAKGKTTPPSIRDQPSPVNAETGSAHDETSSSGNKDDEDDDDDDSDDKIDAQAHDPERLKAFNMFVRLFVDENLDRMVPISKQPKEKIQAIIDSCTRQFPEFAERARKRIRTYLKSCRRNKRARDPNTPWDASRPTPAHLTSVQAEQILATACENESHNAKRMRLGLEPVSQPMPVVPGVQPTDTTAAITRSLDFPNSTKLENDISTTFPSTTAPSTTPNSTTKGSITTDIKTSLSTSNNLGVATINGVGSNSTGSTPTAMYRPNFSQAFQRAGPYPLFPGPPFGAAGLLTTGPADLSLKQKPLVNHKLNTGEMAAVRQLITGYRESAAFLLRSADELEQLLLQQQ
ncbi:nucleolar protein 4 isoform X1 [Rhynchophorus ferrugineus]|uniref:nucleolar protein 4 isoform X1 n=1 Tax=Rhynchophorus ferrugineus TaxID=354439 RepID=UPI003FCE83C7